MSIALPLQGISAWLFDLDGTLVDSAPDLHAALDHTLARFDLPGVDEALVRRSVGRGARVLIEQALEHHQSLAGHADPEAMLPLFLERYQAHIADRSTVYPGVRSTLEQLAARGAALACVTNKYAYLGAEVLRALELDHLFACLIGGDTLPERKPHPAPLLEACRRLGHGAAESVMVGDSINDIEAARAAAMPVICVSYGYNHGEDIHGSGADAIVDSLQALI